MAGMPQRFREGNESISTCLAEYRQPAMFRLDTTNIWHIEACFNPKSQWAAEQSLETTASHSHHQDK